MFVTIVHWMLLTTAFVHSYEADTYLQSSHCLRAEETPSWQRTFHFNNLRLNLTLEVTDNPSHWILNYIFGILAHERLGYQNITFIEKNRHLLFDSLHLLTCRDANCTELPLVHLNLEAWLPIGTSVAFWAPANKVTDHGPLGPISHRAHVNGTFNQLPANFDTVSCSLYNRYSHTGSSEPMYSTNWSCNKMMNCKTECHGAMLSLDSYSKPSRLSSSCTHGGWCNCACALYLRDRFGPVSVARENFTLAFESYQATKISWKELSNRLPLVHHLIDSMRLPQSEFDELVSTATLSTPYAGSDQSRFYKIACEWIRRSRNRWKTWTSGWNSKQNLTIAGLFTLYGKWPTELDKIALQAVQFVNEAPDYFANTEYAVTLDVRNLTCVQDIVVNDYFDLLSSSVDTTLIGVIAALCSDSIEPVVKVANYRQQVIISSTVESSRIVEKHSYPFFFRTVPSMLSVNMALIRILQNWGWRRIAVFRKDDYFFDPRLFQYNHIEVIVDMEMKESHITHEFVTRHLKEMVDRNTRIFIIEHFAQGTAIVLCAAYHLNLRFDRGYVWFINPWLSEGWWKSASVIPRECTYDQMANMTAMTFTVTHQILMPSVMHDETKPDSSAPVVNNVDHSQSDVEYLVPSFKAGRAGSRFRKLRMPRMNFPREVTKAYFTQPHIDYAFYTFESVIVLTTAVLRLLEKYPSAISIFNSPEIADTFRYLIANTKFAYTDKKNAQVTGAASICRLFTPRHELISTEDTKPKGYAHISQLRFSEANERVPDYWLLMQHQVNRTALISMIYSKPGIPSSLFLMKNTSSFPNVSEFNQFVTERRLSDVDWGLNRGIPGDGSETGEDCPFHWLMQLFSVNCVTAIIIFTFSLFLVIALHLIVLFTVYYRRRLREAQRRIRQPYEDLRAELADIDIPCSDVVLNRRVGQGAFGMVFGGEAKRKGIWESVAVKVIGGKATYESKRDFLAEAKLMRELDHKNVVRLIGVCLRPRENHLYLIMENMLLGDLKTYLLPRRVIAQQSPDHEDVRPETLTRMATDIAEGVAYLHTKYLVHRDIACRNCLVGSDKVVKIGDFGLTRKFTTSESEGYYRFTRNRELPIRWMSPEAVQFGVFSIHSDLWSFGITLYEIITFGVLPYDGLGDVEVVERVKQINFSILDYLPSRALNTTVAGLIDQCCQHQWQHRPVSMIPVIKLLRENPNCIRPFLTEAPPKPNKAISALPFQPGAGACIMSENALTGRTPTNPMTVTENPSVSHSTAGIGVLPCRGFHSTTGSLTGAGRCSTTHCSADSYYDATAAALRVIVNESSGRRRHKTADPAVGSGRSLFSRLVHNSSSGAISGRPCRSSQLSFDEFGKSCILAHDLPQGFSTGSASGPFPQSLDSGGYSSSKTSGIQTNPITPTTPDQLQSNEATARSFSAECLPLNLNSTSRASTTHPLNHFTVSGLNDHSVLSPKHGQPAAKSTTGVPNHNCPPMSRSVTGNASHLLRSMFRIFAHPLSYFPNRPLRSSKSTTSCRATHSPTDLNVNKPLLHSATPLVSSSCPPLLYSRTPIDNVSPSAVSSNSFAPLSYSISTSPTSVPQSTAHLPERDHLVHANSSNQSRLPTALPATFLSQPDMHSHK